MRNLKRALSLALASVMLLGMMVVGTSAASTSNFTDADKIVNAEAVDLTTGLDIFKGYTDGSFGPDKAVSRAEAAVVIAKILHGSDVNPANFAGAGKFNDVAPWAEGYVNLVASLGIIVGVGENQFAPDRTVSTVEFSTMLLKALGYYVEADALGADWMLEVTSKANALGLYGDLELAMTAPLTRENVAVMTMNALFAQRVAYDDVRGLYVKNSDRNVVVTNGTVDEYNTLAQNTYGLYAVEGTVVANGYTKIDLEDKTLVIFEEEKDVTGDKIVEASYKFEAETGLDMIGHAATVYYTIEKKAPVVYAIVDQATKVEVTTVGTNLSSAAKAVGFDRDTSDAVIVKNYNLDDTMTAATAYTDAYKNDPAILISNSADETVDYVIIVDQTLDRMDKVSVNKADIDNPITSYTLAGAGLKVEESDVVALNEIEKDDFVIVTMIKDGVKAGTDLAVIEAADTEIETITKITRKYNETKKLASEAVEYAKSYVVVDAAIEASDAAAPALKEAVAYSNVVSKGEYVLVYDMAGKLIAVSPVEEETVVNAAYVAQFGIKINTEPSLTDKYALYAHVYFADGTNGIYTVDTSDFTGNAFKATSITSNTFNGTTVTVDSNAAGTMNATNGEGFGTYVKLYDVAVQENGKIRIKELADQCVAQKTNTAGKSYFEIGNTGIAAEVVVDQVKKGVTWMGVESGLDINDTYYGNSKTTFFLVDGIYDSSKSDKGISVAVVTGMANVPTIDLTRTGDAEDDGSVNQITVAQKTGYKAVETVLVNGYEIYSTDDTLYFYNGNYVIYKNADGKWDVDFTVYNAATAEEAVITYTNYTNYNTAKAEAEKAAVVGFYEDAGSKTAPLTGIYVVANTAVDGGDTWYVATSKFEKFTKQGDILTLYTNANTGRYGVTASDAVVIDLTGNGIDSLEALADLIEARQEIYLNAGVDTAIEGYPAMDTAMVSYSYGEKDNTADFIYITSVIGEYSKDYTGAGSTTVGTMSNVTLAKTGNNNAAITFKMENLTYAKADIKVIRISDSGIKATVANESGLGLTRAGTDMWTATSAATNMTGDASYAYEITLKDATGAVIASFASGDELVYIAQ